MNRVKPLLLAVAVFALAGAHALAQVPRGTIQGRVADASGAVVVSANVTITNEGTGEARSQTSDANGDYVFSNIDPGTYAVKVTAPGFNAYILRGLQVSVNQTVRSDVSLVPGDVATQVNVEASVPVIQTDTTSVGSVVTGQQVMNMPLNGRGNFFSLLALAPGVQGAGQNPIIAGGTWFGSTNQSIDGMTNNDNGNERLNPTTPSLDAVGEFRVIANGASAEFGRGGAQVVMVTRSGTNEYHGTLFYFNRNRATAAKNFFATGLPLPAFNRNEFGGTLGGPIKKNKLFFFGGFEGLRRVVSSTNTLNMPPTTITRGDFSALPTPVRDPFTGQPYPNNQIPSSAISPVARELLNFVSTPNRPGVGPAGLGANYVVNVPTRENNDRYSIRGDWSVTDNDRLTLRYFQANNGPFLSGAGTATERFGSFAGFGLSTRSGLASYTRTITPRMVNEARLGILQNVVFRTPQNADFDPSRLIPGLTSPIEGLGGLPTVNILGFRGFSDQPGSGDDIRSYEFTNILSWSLGRHNLKFGAEFQRAEAENRQNVAPARGSFTFDGRYTGNAFADFLVGAASATSRASRNLVARPSNNRLGAFAQDDLNLTSKLTLNLGVRYEYYGLFQNGLGNMSNFYPDKGLVVLDGTPIDRLMTALPIVRGDQVGLNSNYIARDRNNFAPRVGFAYRPLNSNRLVLRSSYGIYYVVTPAYVGFLNLAQNPPFLTVENFEPAAGTTPSLTWANPFPGSGTIPVNVSVQAHDQNRRTPYFQQWNFTAESEILRNTGLRVSYLGNKGTHLLRNFNLNTPAPAPGAEQPRRPFQPWGPISYYQTAANSITNQLQVGVIRRYSAGLQLQLEYQWTKGLQEQPFGISAPLDNRNARLDRGDADFVRRHYAAFNYIYDLPFGKGRPFGNGVSNGLNRVIGGWQLTGVILAGTGQPFSVTYTSSVLGWPSGRADIVGDPTPADRNLNGWFNPAAYRLPAQFTLGTSARNSLFGPGIFTWDAGLIKTTQITERLGIDFRAEFFNLLNRANFNNPASDITVPSTVGRIRSAQDARTIQFGARLKF